MSQSLTIRRRALLSGIGAATATMFARPLLRAARAAEVGAKPPKRILVLYMPNTSIRVNWLPTGGRNPLTNSGDARQFTLKMGNETLTPAREQMTLVTGLNLNQIVGCNHGSAIIRLMCGSGIKPVKPSFDQVMADQAAALKGTQVSSLQLGTDTRADAGSNGIQLRVMSYDLHAAPLPPEIEPVKTYTRIFSPLVPTTSGPDAQAALTQTLADQRSVLDFVKDDLARLQPRLPSAQRSKLDEHLDGLRELERALSNDTGALGRMLPGPPPAVMPNVSANHKTIVDQYLALIKLALQFDVTRVITFMFASGNSQVSMGDFLPGYTQGALHRIAHAYKPIPLTAATRWYCGVVADYINQLAAVKEADGSSLLDNTIVPFFSEVGQYHEHNDVPFALFGGKNLGHTGGRCLTYPGRTPSDVWVAVARALGVDMASYGDPQFSTGALPELLA